MKSKKARDISKEKDRSGPVVIVSSKDEYFDDCPVCQAMKKAEEEKRELTLEELLEAYAEAERMGGVVGGESDINE